MVFDYARIKKLPLFTGMTDEELKDIAKDIHFEVRMMKKGSTIRKEYEHCNTLLFVSSGWIEITTHSDSRAYSLQEYVEGIKMIEPDKLFGLTQHYRSTYKAHTVCETIGISKDSLLQLLDKYFIVRLNLANAICWKSQHFEDLPWQKKPETTKDTIKHFIKQRSLYPTGRKRLNITLKQLAREIDINRLYIANALDDLVKEEKIITHRGIIEVPALQLL